MFDVIIIPYLDRPSCLTYHKCMNNSRRLLGELGEEASVGYLLEKGYLILARNFRTPHGEIDIVAVTGDLLVFVEVKTRSSHVFAYPEESVTLRKQAYMLSAAEYYLDSAPEKWDTWQFDVIAVETNPKGDLQIDHFENVIG